MDAAGAARWGDAWNFRQDFSNIDYGSVPVQHLESMIAVPRSEEEE
jgi:hypothetical protein